MTFSALVLAILLLFTQRMHVEGSCFSEIKIQNKKDFRKVKNVLPYKDIY